jgi:hypothetical protein
MQPPEVRGKLVLYCFRGGGKGWVEPRAQPCPKVKRWLWKACPILLPRWWDGMGRAQSPIMPEGRQVVWPKCNFSKESYREGLSRLDIRRRCCRSQTKVVCREGERRWCAVGANEGGENSACAACAANSSLRGKPEDATARERASKKEHPTVKW